MLFICQIFPVPAQKSGLPGEWFFDDEFKTPERATQPSGRISFKI